MTSRTTTAIGAGAVLASLVAVNAGAAFAKHLFPIVGAYGTTALRITIAAFLLVVIRRPWLHPIARSAWPNLAGYGVALGLMNLLIYQAFARLPLGIAVGIEVLGPLAVVLVTSRTRRDLLWFAIAVTGLALLLPLRAAAPLDPVGILFASGAATCWALYIVYGKRLAAHAGADAVPWGLLIAAAIALPIGVATTPLAALTPAVFAMGFAVAVLSSALPFVLEMEAMRRLPARVFGMFLSAAPAIAAIAGFLVLHEMLTAVQWLAIVCVIVASAGSAITR